jgi:hypothetical protein
MKQINNNGVPKGTKDKMYSAVVSPNNKCCMMKALVSHKHILMTSKVHSWPLHSLSR